MGVRNKWTFLFITCYNPMVSKVVSYLKAKLIMNSYFGLSRVIRTLKSGLSSPKLDWYQWLRYTLLLWRNLYSWKSSMDTFVMEQSAIQERNTNTKAWIFPQRFSMFHTFWCEIGSKMNLSSLYRRLLIAVSTLVISAVAISTPSSFKVAVSTELRRYRDGNVKLCLFSWPRALKSMF